MPRMTLGICPRALNQPLRRSLPMAAKMGATCLELDAAGELDPRRLSQTARREVGGLFRSHQLALAALACPMRVGLDVPEQQEERIDYVCQAMSLSFDLGSRVVVIQQGEIPTDEKDPRFRFLADALMALGQHGDRIGATLALETGIDSAETLTTLLDRFDTGSLVVAYNPGNLLVHGHDPYQAVRSLKQRIKLIHAVDARRAGSGRLARRVAVGHGDLDWLLLAGTFAEIEYVGPILVESDPVTSAAADLAAGLAFLRKLIPAA